MAIVPVNETLNEAKVESEKVFGPAWKDIIPLRVF